MSDFAARSGPIAGDSNLPGGMEIFEGSAQGEALTAEPVVVQEIEAVVSGRPVVLLMWPGR